MATELGHGGRLPDGNALQRNTCFCGGVGLEYVPFDFPPLCEAREERTYAGRSC